MKKIKYSLFVLALSLGCGACNEDNLPEANFSLFQAESLTATAGDMQVSLAWSPSDKGAPDAYYITWSAATAGVVGGEKTVTPDTRSLTIDNLVNSVSYTFSVQSRYSQGLSGKISAKCTPVTSRYAVTDFKAEAGPDKVRLTWSRPDDTTNPIEHYSVHQTPGDKTIRIDDPAAKRYIVENLNVGTEYTFSLTAVYKNGSSDAVVASATPGDVTPINATLLELAINEPVTFSVNDLYFMKQEIKSASWTFGDGRVSTELTPQHRYLSTGNFEVEVTVTYVDDTTEKGDIRISVVNFKWATVSLDYNGYVGMVKASNPVFSKDGGTIYIPTSNKAGHLFAIDAYTGKIKWVHEIPDKVTYGGGAAVGPDGTIFQGARNAVMYAIDPQTGKDKWTFTASGNIDCFPAITSDNKLYFCANGSGSATAYALDGSTGAELWTKTLDGATGSAAAVDAQGNVYFGTSAAVYSFTADGSQRWKTSSALNVTGGGSFALYKDVLYAALTGGSGVAAIIMDTGGLKWKGKGNSTGDAYFPIVDREGSVYYTDKGAKTVHAFKNDGSPKWETNVAAQLIYGGLVLSDLGRLYVGTQGKTEAGSYLLLTLNYSTGNIISSENSAEQIMAAFTIGPDKRLYYGTVAGKINTREIDVSLAEECWPMRGGNQQGTNSLK